MAPEGQLPYVPRLGSPGGSLRLLAGGVLVCGAGRIQVGCWPDALPVAWASSQHSGHSPGAGWGAFQTEGQAETAPFMRLLPRSHAASPPLCLCDSGEQSQPSQVPGEGGDLASWQEQQDDDFWKLQTPQLPFHRSQHAGTGPQPSFWGLRARGSCLSGLRPFHWAPPCWPTAPGLPLGSSHRALPPRSGLSPLLVRASWLVTAFRLLTGWPWTVVGTAPLGRAPL